MVDRGIQTLKKDLATRVARTGSGATTSSGRPGPTTRGPTRRCTARPRTWRGSRPRSSGSCKTTPTSAGAFEELRPSVRRRAAAGGRGLHDRPQHGGRETLLLLAPQGSGNAAGRLTRRGRPAAVRQLDDFLAPPRPGPSTNLKMIFEALFRPPCVQGRLKQAPFGAKKPRKKGFETLRRLVGNSRSLLSSFLGCSANQRVGRTNQMSGGWHVHPRRIAFFVAQKCFWGWLHSPPGPLCAICAISHKATH